MYKDTFYSAQQTDTRVKRARVYSDYAPPNSGTKTHFLCILHVYPQQTVGTDAAIIMAYRYTLQEQIEA